MVDRAERKHRLRTITTLIVELEKIKAVTIQATGIGEMIIEAIIEGDWSEAETIAADLEIPVDEKDVFGRDARHRALWESFTIATRTAIAEASRLQPGVRPRRN